MMSILLPFVLIVSGAAAAPQFGLSIPKSPSPAALPVAIPSTPTAAVSDTLGYTKKIEDLVGLVRTTLTSMGEIAVEDNPEVGAKIVVKLQAEIAKASKILVDFTTSSVRAKREVKSGDVAYNSVGEVLVNSNDKIEPEKKQLSPKAKKRINKKHKEGVEKCGADSCKAAAKTLQEAEDAEDERQR